LCNRPPQRVGVHVIDKTALPVDLHDRDPLAVGGLELGVAVDCDLAQLEAEFLLRSLDDSLGGYAEVAARRSEEGDFGYG
jgi:hypothetical protein